MKKNSINNGKGCSVCKTGKENYTTFNPAHRPQQVFYQYDYRTENGELFSTVAPTLEQCRERRDKWIQEKNRQRLSPALLQKMREGKRLTKCDMACQIGRIAPCNAMSISWDLFSREEIAAAFNRMFGMDIE